MKRAGQEASGPGAQGWREKPAISPGIFHVGPGRAGMAVDVGGGQPGVPGVGPGRAGMAG